MLLYPVKVSTIFSERYKYTRLLRIRHVSIMYPCLCSISS